MKLVRILVIFTSLLSNNGFAEPLLTQSDMISKSNACFKYLQNKLCKNLIMEMEKIQIQESALNRFKCQSSILGLQSELVEAYYSKNFNKSKNGIMIPYVIKNC